jgi:hypothetical protein
MSCSGVSHGSASWVKEQIACRHELPFNVPAQDRIQAAKHMVRIFRPVSLRPRGHLHHTVPGAPSRQRLLIAEITRDRA